MSERYANEQTPRQEDGPHGVFFRLGLTSSHFWARSHGRMGSAYNRGRSTGES